MKKPTILAIKNFYFAFSVFLSLNSVAASAAEQTVVCPEKLPAESVSIINSPVGWNPFTNSSLRLSGMGIIYGPPESKAMAKPYSATKTKNGSIVKWMLSNTPSEEVWVTCSYGKDVALTLSQPLKHDPKECTAIYKNSKDAELSIEFSCK